MVAKHTTTDFDLDTLIKSDQHTKDIGDLSARITVLELRYSSNENFGNTFQEASKTVTKVKEVIKESLNTLLLDDKGIREGIKGIIKESDKESVWRMLKRFVTLIGWLLSLVVTALVTYLFSR